MHQWKSVWSVCPQCRLRLMTAALRDRRTGARRTLTTATTALRNVRADPYPRSMISNSRQLSSSPKWRGAQEARRQETQWRDDPSEPPPFERPRDANREHEHELQEGTSYGMESLEQGGERASPEEMARAARNFFGETLPQGALSVEEYSVYTRMYGEPSRITTDHLTEELVAEDGNVLYKDNEDGTMDEYQVVEQPEEDQVVDEDADLDEEEEVELDTGASSEDVAGLQSQINRLAMQEQLNTVDETSLTFGEIGAEGETAQSRSKDEILDEIYDNWPEDDSMRSHPLTDAGKFGTKPSTIQLPQEALIQPVQQMMSAVSNKHLSEAAQKALGGVGIPDSPSTPAIGRSKGQRPIPLTAMQSKMSPMEANVFVTSVMPQVYASVVSILVECRKRMGKAWLRGLMDKEGGPLVLDAGAGGAGIMAFREILKTEWESMEEDKGVHRPIEGLSRRLAPLGRATVVTGSDSLRLKSSAMLENTTFIPRLPDYVDPTETETNAQQPRKRYDVIIAPHTLWPLLEEHERKTRTQNLWSLLSPNGGVLVLIEKGVPRGFEVVAGARDLLLSKHISSPESESYENTMEERGASSNDPRRERYTTKEKGSIIAPCTNHTQCPLYPVPGVSRGRKDWCYFQQRYTRPSYLMNVLQAKARNHDDVEFSYLAVQRGADIRQQQDDKLQGTGFAQGPEATEKAKAGYGPPRRSRSDEDALEEPEIEEAEQGQYSSDISTQASPHPLSLPRIVPGPLKRKGHILLDVCTPSGTYERWMVRKGMGKQVFRDARKAKWGDLWAMGASSSEERRLKLGTPMEVMRLETKRARERAKGWRKGRDGGKGKWQFGGSGNIE